MVKALCEPRERLSRPGKTPRPRRCAGRGQIAERHLGMRARGEETTGFRFFHSSVGQTAKGVHTTPAVLALRYGTYTVHVTHTSPNMLVSYQLSVIWDEGSRKTGYVTGTRQTTQDCA